MDHHIITIDASPSQLSKLRRGFPVRVRKGKGFNVVVHPQTYKLASRAFTKDKGMQLMLSPEELELNRSLSPEMHMRLRETQPEIAGQGIFGKKFDKMLKKAGIKKLAYKVGDELKPAVKGLITSGLAAGTAGLSAYAPALAPVLAPMAGMAGSMASDYLDNPSKYQKSGVKGQTAKDLITKTAMSMANEQLNERLGTNYDYLSRAGLEHAITDQLAQRLSDQSVGSRYSRFQPVYESPSGTGFGRREKRVHGGTVGLDGGLLYPLPPALKSQPYAANFHMQYFLPPAYQSLHTGSGLYAGKGLYA